jgi:hypothetical protein
MFLIRHVCLVLSSYRVFHKASLTEESPAFVSLLPSIHKGLFMLHDMNFSFVQKREDRASRIRMRARGEITFVLLAGCIKLN